MTQPPFEAVDGWQAVALAERVRRREVTPLELVEQVIERIDRLNPVLNAVITPLYEAAVAQASGPDPGGGPFAGVPFLLKDLSTMQRGQPYTAGNGALRAAGYRSPHDTPLGRRFREAGLITVGKTNTPEFGQPANRTAFGPEHNPWALERSTCGSSGGSCAAVAAGIVPAAHANDGSGSIRLPAAWCGVVGLKPSRGRISGGAPKTEIHDVEGVVTRTVLDTAALLDAVHGPEPGDLFAAPAPQRPFAEEVSRDPRPMRIGVLLEAGETTPSPLVADAVERTAGVLVGIGHGVEAARIDALGELPPADLVAGASRARRRQALARLAVMLGRDVGPEDVEPSSWALSEPGMPAPEAGVLLAYEDWQHEWAARVARWTYDYDVLLTPTCPKLAMRVEDVEPPVDPAADTGWFYSLIGEVAAYTAPFNVTGQPAISLPLHQSPDGLPIGIQFIGAHGDEARLLRIAGQLERVTPWADRWAPISIAGDQRGGLAPST